MYETPLTVVGRIATAPERRRAGDGEVVTFRIASNERKRDAAGEWVAGNSLFLTVNCWGQLGVGVSASLSKGDKVIVVGKVYTTEYDDREGVRHSYVEMRAYSVGPDLSRCFAQLRKVEQVGSGIPAEPPSDDVPESNSVDVLEPMQASA